jgi:hypothetical protein
VKTDATPEGTVNESRQEFVPGMNYHNFRILGGMWPNYEEIDEKIESIAHPDRTPWNFVVPGPLPIDTEDKFA